MKSALELAMERTESMVDKDAARLTGEQLEAIDRIRKEHEAKWAEQEIAMKGRLDEMARQDPRAFAEHRRQFQDEMSQVRERIYAERDEKIARVRDQGRN